MFLFLLLLLETLLKLAFPEVLKSCISKMLPLLNEKLLLKLE